MRVQDVMTEEVQSCHPETPMDEAGRRMWEADCGALPVVDSESRVLGMVTDRDLCMAAVIRGRRLDEMPVGLAMSHEVQSCDLEDSLRDVLEVMGRQQVRRLPVVDESHVLVGLVSLADVIRATRGLPKADRALFDVETALAAICARRGAEAVREMPVSTTTR